MQSAIVRMLLEQL